MNSYKGNLRKLRSQHAATIEYQLPIGDQLVSLNQQIGKPLTLSFSGKINCIQCNRAIKKSFQQGYCYPCMQKINECNNCQLFPERCLHGEGKCNPDDWAHVQCMQPHVVYLANSSGLKVGITRETQMPTRWIDQGAVAAIPIFSTTNRYQCGVLEVALKDYASDKTDWRKMLKNDVIEVDLVAERDRLLMEANAVIETVVGAFPAGDISPIEDVAVLAFNYPVASYPAKIKSASLDKSPSITGVLQGIKGQYLIFDGFVMNVRKFGGYEVEVTL